MTTVLSQGANTAVGAPHAIVTLTWPAGPGVLDPSAYLLTSAGKVRNDDDMVFYNQPSGAGGAVKITSQKDGGTVFELDLSRMPAAIERIVFCLTADNKTLAAFNGAALDLSAGGASVATFRPDMGGASEAAMMFAELYLRNDQWKIRAVAQGFNGGLAPLARSFGIDVAEPAPTAAPAPAPTPAPIPAPASKPISLSKVTLDKAKPTISLEKQGSDFGEIIINLNWSQSNKGGGLFGSRKGLDLDLGCLYELRNGDKGIVQALGNCFGSYQHDPYIELSGDDRTGAVAAGETLRVNGARWNEIARIALYAYIYEGAPNWQATDGVITIKMPSQPPIEIRLSDGQNQSGFCGIALIENSQGSMKFSRLIEYFRGHREFDQRVGWGLQWRAGSKS